MEIDWSPIDKYLGEVEEEKYLMNPDGEEPFCSRCLCVMMKDEAEAVCVCLTCGISKPVLVFRQNYNDITYERVGYLYKRITHLRKHWRAFQTKIGNKRVDDLTDRIEMMFKAIESPFRKYKPPERRNFFNYKYLLLKFFELINRPDLCIHLEYLKSKEKLRQHDEIWKKICADFKWKFIPSIRRKVHKRVYKKRIRKKPKSKVKST